MSEEICEHNTYKSQCEICRRQVKIGSSKELEEGETITITKTKKGEKSKEELEAELEHLKGTLEIISDKAYEEKVEALKSEFPESSEAIENLEPEELDAFERGLRSQKREKPQYMGKAGLVDAQRVERFGRRSGEKGYPTAKAMLDDLRKAEREGSKEAKRILEELWKKLHGKLSDLPSEPSKEQRKEYHEPTVSEGFYKIRKKKKGED